MHNVPINAVLILMLGLSGCSTTVEKNQSLMINGSAYPLNEEGEVVLTQSELRLLKESGSVARIHPMSNSVLAVDPKEMNVLMQDSEIFYSELDGHDRSGNVSVLVKKGSLRGNLERLSEEKSWGEVTWDVCDFTVPEPFAVIGPDIQTVIMEVLNGYPLYVNFDNKSIVVTKPDTMKTMLCG